MCQHDAELIERIKGGRQRSGLAVSDLGIVLSEPNMTSSRMREVYSEDGEGVAHTSRSTLQEARAVTDAFLTSPLDGPILSPKDQS